MLVCYTGSKKSKTLAKPGLVGTMMRKLRVEELNRLSAEQARQAAKAPLAIVLDNVRSGLNVGSAFRTADAFALEQVMLCGITAQPPHREILKTALGAEASANWRHEAQTEVAIERLRAEGFQIWAVEQAEGSVLLSDFRLSAGEKYALIFGNEVRGVGEKAMNLADGAIEVPQAGAKHSLNIAVCIGIVVWELFRQWRFDV
jgi:23S rRNA (guanosine2251-2'-O)-methyltransferase